MFKAVQNFAKKLGKLHGFKMNGMWAALHQGPADETTCNKPRYRASHLNDGLSLADQSWELPRACLSLVDLRVRRLARFA